VYMAQSIDGGSSWTVVKASDHDIHKGGICISGLGCAVNGGDRTLLDFFQVSIDPTNGAADIAYTDDHASPGSSILYFTRQCSGDPAIAGLTTPLNDCVEPPTPQPPPHGSTCPGPQIVDFTGDAPNNYPAGDGANMDNLDIVNASFATPDATHLQVKLTIKNLAPPPPPANMISAFWTVYWDFNGTTYFAQATVNGFGGPSPEGLYSFSDGTYSGGTYTAVGSPTGPVTQGPNGTIVMTLLRSDVGTPANGALLTNTFADTHGSFTVAGGGVYFTAAADRAPDSGYGSDYFVGQTCPPPTSADVSVTKTDSPDPVAPNGTLTYTIKVHNGGPDTATDVQMNDPLPSSVTFQTVGTTQGSCTTGQTVSCYLGTMSSGTDATVTITVKVSQNPPSTISNTATVSSSTPDPNSSNNSSTATTSVTGTQTTSADVSVTKSDSPDPVDAGGTLTYTIVVKNNGPNAAQNVQMTDTLPASVTWQSTNNGSCSGTSTVTCNLGTLNSGQSATVTIKVTVNSTAPPTISNTASASSTTADPNSANNSSTATTTVRQPSQMPGYSAISSNFNGTPIAAGNCIWFNSVLKIVGNLPSGPRTVSFKNELVTFSANGTPYNLAVPDGTITFDPNAQTATITYSTGWTETVPMTGENVFLSGRMFTAPAGGLPGGIKPVTWSGNFSSDGPVQFNWQWAAAVYTKAHGACSANYNQLGVKPVHSNTLDAYHNGDQAGTPENYKSDVTGGATGGGGSNYTGGYSGTAQIKLN
jgi:uncharacterized repeat protein (TIGR01451 family)